MARLAVRKLHYEGLKYTFTSPELGNGIVIIEGENGSGKSTFSDLIYYGLGGNPSMLRKDGRAKHREITSDLDNFVEVIIEINDIRFKLKRFIGGKDIAIFSASALVGVFPIHRSKDTRQTFSDWILEKLGVDTFNLYFNRYKGRISFNDLLRLIYHDQSQDADKVYKQHDTENNFVSDSAAFRKAIFEVLIGQSFTEYYSALDKLHEIDRNVNETRGAISAFAVTASRISKAEDWNTTKLTEELLAINSQLERLSQLRNSLRSTQNLGDTSSVLPELRRQLDEIQLDQSDHQEKLNSVFNELRSLQELKRKLILEVTQLKKIIFTHEQLNLFSPDTCPYCLSKINRAHGKCICGSDVDESNYERFFYSTAEYIEILKSKQRNVDTVGKAIQDCEEQAVDLKSKLDTLRNQNESVQANISSVVGTKTAGIDFSKLDEVDNKILDLRSREDALVKQLSLEKSRQELEDKLSGLENTRDSLGAIVDKLEATAREQMNSTVLKFNEKYNKLLQDTVANCRRARLDDSYMPVINDGDHVEASAVVPKRLMYFLTLLSLSLEDAKMYFPRFLLIDTPDTAGIDDENLKKAIAKLPEVVGKNSLESCQVILTTGKEMYPDELNACVAIRLSKDARLLKERPTK